MAVFNSFTFDGNNSLDYGIYITGEAVYNAPERVVEMVSVPGRNGNIAIDQGRFENIEVTYHAGCFADSQADFADKVMRFRNALASRYTYKRLTDEYHSDEYRLGLYKSGLDVEAVRYGTAGQFDITFDCKPQRFLLSGETAVTPSDYGNPQTETGEIVTIESDGSLGVKSLEVSLEPIQEGSGEPSPTNIRPISGRTEVETVVSPTTDAEDGRTYTTALGRTVYGGTLDVVSGELVVDRAMVDLGTLSWGMSGSGNTAFFYANTSALGIASDITTTLNYICENYSIVPVSSGGTRTGMAFTSVSQLRIRDATYNDATSFKTAMNGVQLVYELATPQTYQLTPQQIDLLLGTNHLWSDGEITVEYGTHPYYNPTQFESKPLIVVTGKGILQIGDYVLTIVGRENQTIYIDCESQEAWEVVGAGRISRNDYIQNAGEEFPVLVPGINNISVGSGITAVTITPRWWRI